MNTVAEETFSNIRTVKAFSSEDSEIKKYSVANVVTYNAGKKKAAYQALFSFVNMIMVYGSMIAVIYVGKILFQDGDISVGELSSFMFYMLMVSFNFMIMGFVFGNLASVSGASQKVVQFMQTEPEIKTKDPSYRTIPGEIRGRLEINNIKFTYPSKREEGNQVLKGVSFNVDNEKNRVVALCGTSGCGKSSIIQLLERFYDPDEGEILFNGVNIKELDPKWYHN